MNIKKTIRKTRSWLAFLLFAIAAYLITKPKAKKKITSEEIEKRINDRMNQKGIIYLLMDQEYRLPTLESMKEFLKNDQTDKIAYQKEVFDCDDYSMRLCGNFTIPGYSDLAIGIIGGMHKIGPHAANIFLTEDEIYYLEPQTDEIKPLSKEDWKELWFVIMS